jgi:hypothetical protein
MRVTLGILFMLFVDIMLFISQLGVNAAAQEMNITGQSTFFDYNSNYISGFDKGNYTLNSDISESLPSGQGTIQPENGNFFTDTWSTMVGWMKTQAAKGSGIVKGLQFAAGLVSCVPDALKMVGLPSPISFALGVVWHAITAFLIIAWLKGFY